LQKCALIYATFAANFTSPANRSDNLLQQKGQSPFSQKADLFFDYGYLCLSGNNTNTIKPKILNKPSAPNHCE
jgi:hypothetical protein